MFKIAGNTTVDSVFQVLLSTPMFVGGISGFIFDNTIPGKNTWNEIETGKIDLFNLY